MERETLRNDSDPESGAEAGAETPTHYTYELGSPEHYRFLVEVCGCDPVTAGFHVAIGAGWSEGDVIEIVPPEAFVPEVERLVAAGRVGRAVYFVHEQWDFVHRMLSPADRERLAECLRRAQAAVSPEEWSWINRGGRKLPHE